MTPKKQARKELINRLDFVIFLNCVSKNSIKKVKRQPLQEKKIFVNHILDNNLKFRINEELLKLSNKSQAAQLQNQQRLSIDISPSKTDK